MNELELIKEKIGLKASKLFLYLFFFGLGFLALSYANNDWFFITLAVACCLMFIPLWLEAMLIIGEIEEEDEMKGIEEFLGRLDKLSEKDLVTLHDVIGVSKEELDKLEEEFLRMWKKEGKFEVAIKKFIEKYSDNAIDAIFFVGAYTGMLMVHYMLLREMKKHHCHYKILREINDKCKTFIGLNKVMEEGK